MAQAFETATRGRRNGALRGAVKSRAHDVLEDFAELRKDMNKLADALGRAAQHEVSATGHRIENVGRSLLERADDSATYVQDQVRDRPVAAIGIAAGVGMLLGMMLSRR